MTKKMIRAKLDTIIAIMIVTGTIILSALFWCGLIAIICCIAITPLFIIVLPIFLIKLLWNWLMPVLFHLPLIGFWKAAGLLLIVGLVFGGLRIRINIGDK